jgi:hypothetical protein
MLTARIHRTVRRSETEINSHARTTHAHAHAHRGARAHTNTHVHTHTHTRTHTYTHTHTHTQNPLVLPTTPSKHGKACQELKGGREGAGGREGKAQGGRDLYQRWATGYKNPTSS